MNGEKSDRSPACEPIAHLSFKDAAIAIFAVAIVPGDCGVVRALDIALDAIRR